MVSEINKVVLIGLGALGCAYASKLHDLNPACFAVVAGGKRANDYKSHGFFINSKRYDFNYVSPEEKSECADLILVAVKAHQLNQAISDMKNLVGENTTILSLLNGITSEEIIGKEYGMDKMLYCVSYGLTANKEGTHVSFPSYGTVAFGDKLNKQLSKKVQAVKSLFERAGIPHTIPENMLHALWWKFMFNVGINQCSAVTGGRFGVFQTDTAARRLLDASMREVLVLSEKTGVNLTELDLEKWYEILATLNPDSRTSMLEDIESGRKTEVEFLGGTVCELGERYGVKTPVSRTLYDIIQILEKRNK